MGQQTGKIKRVFADKGFGFITGDDGVDYFLHSSECRGVSLGQLNTGDLVSFTPGDGPKGPRASEASRA